MNLSLFLWFYGALTEVPALTPTLIPATLTPTLADPFALTPPDPTKHLKWVELIS